MRGRLFALLFATGIITACNGHHAVPAPQTQSQKAAGRTTLSAAAPASVSITQLRAPDFAAGGITVATDGAVYLNGYGGYVRYSSGAFTRFAYPLPAGSSGIGSVDGQNTITVGPGGTVWAALYRGSCCPPSGAELASVSSAGSISESSAGTTAGDAFDSVAPDGLNHLWAIHQTGTPCVNARYSVSIVDSSFTPLADFTLPTSSRLNAITRGPDGMMYVATALACGAGAAEIFRINPTTHAVLDTITLQAGSLVKEMTAGPDGAVWFTNDTMDEIDRLASTGAVTHYPLPVPKSQPTGITLGADGALWFTEEIATPQTIKVGRITTSGAITEYLLGYQGPYLMASEISAGPPGGVPVPHTLYVVARGFPYLFKLTF